VRSGGYQESWSEAVIRRKGSRDGPFVDRGEGSISDQEHHSDGGLRESGITGQDESEALNDSDEERLVEPEVTGFKEWPEQFFDCEATAGKCRLRGRRGKTVDFEWNSEEQFFETFVKEELRALWSRFNITDGAPRFIRLRGVSPSRWDPTMNHRMPPGRGWDGATWTPGADAGPRNENFIEHDVYWLMSCQSSVQCVSEGWLPYLELIDMKETCGPVVTELVIP